MAISFALVLLASLGLALMARRGHGTGDPRQFFAGGGQFGALLFFTLSVGEAYSAGSVLGFPGGVMAQGTGFALWFTGYILLAFPIGYCLYPALWRAGRVTGALTVPDLFAAHFASPHLGRWIGCFLLVLMLPLGTMQFIGLQTVLAQLAPSLPASAAAGSAALLAFAFVAIAGLRATALVSLLKDTLVLAAILIVAGACWWHWHDQPTRDMAQALHAGSPVPLRADLGILSTLMLQAVGFCIAPQTTAAIFSARSPATIRRAQIFMPLYMALFPLLFVIAGYGLTHALHFSRADGIFLSAGRSLLPASVFGLVLGAVALTALVWLGAVCLSLGAIVTRNIAPHLEATSQKRWSLVVMAAYLGLSVLGAQAHTVLIANLNTLFYLGLIQLLPGIVLIVRGARASFAAVLSGLVIGCSLALFLREAAIDLAGINPGLAGLALNALTVTSFWAMKRRPA